MGHACVRKDIDVYPQALMFTQAPWVNIKLRGYASMPVGPHQSLWVHINPHGRPWKDVHSRGLTSLPPGWTSSPVGTHQAPWVHIKPREYTSSPVGRHQAPWVDIKPRG